MTSNLTLFYILLSVSIISIIPLIHLFVLYLRTKEVKKIGFYLLSFATGSLLATSFNHLMPYSYKTLSNFDASFFILIGFSIFFLLEIFFRYLHLYNEKFDHCKRIIWLISISDTIHNFIDGAAITNSFLISSELGFATTLAIFSHEIPQEISDTAVFIYHGTTILQAVFLNFISALAAFSGALLTLYFHGSFSNKVNFITAITSGGFIYLGASILIPKIHKITNLKKTLAQIVFFILGILITFLI